ncbi:TetR/AcrR family transcriptional regulator [Streptomyces hokutonensis]|uniref:TetR/AcrR family transcriptional regulator n=1 Tax=Streptomyces hokutonensis TaxID=1306990 RepID=UPI00036146A9|nr:TetR/AcrR family transcriptional regulator [Streptomyces hokutonensis]
MSRATLVRYFPTKEDVLLVMTEDHARHAQDALERRPDDEPIWTALRHALEPAVRQDKDSGAALETAWVIVPSPSVRSRCQERYLQMRDLLRPEVVRRTGGSAAAASRPGHGCGAPARPVALPHLPRASMPGAPECCPSPAPRHSTTGNNPEI